MMRCGIRYQGSPEAKLRGFSGAVKEANFAAIRYWHGRFLPLHFAGSASQTYGYRKRSPQYMRRKGKSLGHQRPLELTGTMKQAVTRSIRISGTSKRARGAMSGARVANFHANASPSMREELTAVTKAEADTLAETHAAELTRRLNAIQDSETARS